MVASVHDIGSMRRDAERNHHDRQQLVISIWVSSNRAQGSVRNDPYFESGAFRPLPISRSYGLDESRDAYLAVAGGARGRIVFIRDPNPNGLCADGPGSSVQSQFRVSSLSAGRRTLGNLGRSVQWSQA